MKPLQISLVAARVNAEMTQKQVAESLDVDRSTIRRWEKGEKIPDVDQSMKLASLYGLTLDNIFFGKKTR